MATIHEGIQLVPSQISTPLSIAERRMKDSETNAVQSRNLISIIVPVYNEQSNIPSLLKHMKDILTQTLFEYEVIVVNDGSTDDTLKTLLQEEKIDGHVKIVSYSNNSGKGYAVKQGIMCSKGDMVLFLDGDLDISPEQIKKYIKELGGFDLVIASKTHPESNVISPRHRKLLSKAYSLLVRSIVGIKVKDTDRKSTRLNSSHP